MNDGETAKALFRQGLDFLDSSDFKNAELRFRDTLNLLPRSVPTLTNLAIALFRQGRISEAREAAERAAAIDSNSIEALLVVANCCAAQEKPADALIVCERIIAIDPKIADVHCNRGQALRALGRFEESLASYDQAIAIAPDLAAAHTGRGNAAAELRRHDEALVAFDRALSLKPDNANAWYGRGNVFVDLKRFDDALGCYDRALKLNLDLAEAWFGRGNAFANRQQYDDGLAAYDRALTLKPDFFEAWLGRGNISFELKRYDDALSAYDRTLAIKPELANGWLGRGNALLHMRRYEDAISAYDKAIAADPGLNYAEGLRLTTKLQVCDWSNYGDACARVLTGLNAEVRVAPFDLVVLPCSPADQLRSATLLAADRFPPSDRPLALGARYAHDRIRVAYLSADLHEHATAYLIAGVFEQHDRKRFEITALSFGPDSRSEIRTRLHRAVERFVDVRNRSDFEIAATLRELEIDIAVDLKGYTSDCRPGIFRHRGAPIQVNYLGYPGTMGADYFDYIIGDRVVIPEDHQRYYAEKVVYLPDSYQPNDAKRKIADAVPTRAGANLPERAFVFCSFNNNYKTNPEIFDVWMRFLLEVEGSVLWLYEGYPAAPANLRREAEKRGVAPKRLVFAPRLAPADHLARHRLADLFLDTVPCNAHTTASDALWADLPVLTCLGETFAGRVAASLLHAVGIPELVTASLADYEAMALTLARNPAQLAALKAKLARNRRTCPLFDTERYTRHLESAYEAMWNHNQRQQAPASFAVEPIGLSAATTRAATSSRS